MEEAVVQSRMVQSVDVEITLRLWKERKGDMTRNLQNVSESQPD